MTFDTTIFAEMPVLCVEETSKRNYVIPYKGSSLVQVRERTELYVMLDQGVKHDMLMTYFTDLGWKVMHLALNPQGQTVMQLLYVGVPAWGYPATEKEG